ncbi:MAG: excinuclease ABC subunit UvrA [Chitinispirillia bacterium]|nr:excinuclease ABC subunit UvrA [Chitinispirillia bacterium]MCL2241573.1 excinuclease ABC subunit UvrA [Chitinispirillia bacterium]
MTMRDIEIRGARVHNLKNIDVTIPRNSLTVITGLSGSGKSSLAFDTLYSESQRRYVESLSAYARQFLGLMEKPDVDRIDGLSPAISIEQKTTSHNPRSTVGTITEIHDYLRLLYARVGTPTCYKCGRIIARQSIQEITGRIIALKEGTKFQILAPVVNNRKGSHKELLEKLQKNGYVRVRVDNVIYNLDDDIPVDAKKKHNIEVVIDRLISGPSIASRLAESLETALSVSAEETVIADIIGKEELLFSQRLACPVCGISCDQPTPAMFSFNSPQGACEECHGLGFLLEIDPDLVAPDQTKTLLDGAIIPWNGAYIDGGWNNHMLHAVCKKYKIPMNIPYKSLSAKHKDILLHGSGGEKFEVEFHGKDGKSHARFNRAFEGVIPNLLRRHKDTSSEDIRRWIETFMAQRNCPACNGTRYKKQILAILVEGKNIAELSHMSIESTLKFFMNYKPTGHAIEISKPVIREILQRLGFLNDVGLSYLTLDRTAGTLSGGESQRIRLATQIGSRLTGVLYILDEPSIGLHPRDNTRLLATLTALRDLDNTVVVIEHDKETIMAADHLIDIGPGAGVHGGELVACGTPEQVAKNKKSMTGQYLSGKKSIPMPAKRRAGSGLSIKVNGATGHNLKNVDAEFPLGMLVCVTGVSGSGKSSLVNQTLYPALQKKLYGSKTTPLPYKSISGLSNLDKVIDIDQSPIGRTPRSNPATYTKVFDAIRNLFAMLPESKIRGYQPGRFSFNVKGGRCETCEGDGELRIEMHFLPDVYVKCENCGGKRYNRETLEVLYKGRSISDVLEMTVDEALLFFDNLSAIRQKLQVLSQVGLGYIRLGQPANTLSGGEAQRIKLASELAKRATGKTLYILDEPTTGLHFEDILMLMSVIQELVDKGNSVIVIEHNLDVMKCADYIIDLGPEGGDRGGTIIAAGTPEQIVKNRASVTGKYLKEYL